MSTSYYNVKLFQGKKTKFARLVDHDDKNGSKCVNTGTVPLDKLNQLKPGFKTHQCTCCKRYIKLLPGDAWGSGDEVFPITIVKQKHTRPKVTQPKVVAANVPAEVPPQEPSVDWSTW